MLKSEVDISTEISMPINKPVVDQENLLGDGSGSSNIWPKHRRSKTLGGPWTRNSEGSSNQWVRFGWGPPDPSGALDIVHPVRKPPTSYNGMLERFLMHIAEIRGGEALDPPLQTMFICLDELCSTTSGLYRVHHGY